VGERFARKNTTLKIPLFIFRQDGLMYKFKAPTRATNIRGDQEEKIVFKIIETSGNLGNIVIIIYNYFTGKSREFYFT